MTDPRLAKELATLDVLSEGRLQVEWDRIDVLVTELDASDDRAVAYGKLAELR